MHKAFHCGQIINELYGGGTHTTSLKFIFAELSLDHRANQGTTRELPSSKAWRCASASFEKTSVISVVHSRPQCSRDNMQTLGFVTVNRIWVAAPTNHRSPRLPIDYSSPMQMAGLLIRRPAADLTICPGASNAMVESCAIITEKNAFPSLSLSGLVWVLVPTGRR